MTKEEKALMERLRNKQLELDEAKEGGKFLADNLLKRAHELESSLLAMKNERDRAYKTIQSIRLTSSYDILKAEKE